MLMSFLDALPLAALRREGFQSRIHTTESGRVHVLDAVGQGKLPPMLLLHGIGSSAADYYFLLRSVRRHCRRVVALDFPGHGRSEVPSGGMEPEVLQRALLQATDAVVNEPMIVFGNSLGGLVALRFALRRPDRVKALMVASPAGAPMVPGELAQFLDRLVPKTHADAVDFVDRFLARPTRFRHLIAWGLRHRFGKPAVADFLSRVRPQDMLTPEELATLKMPLVVFWGQQDRVLPEVQREFYRKNLPPHAKFEFAADYGHAPFLDHPAAFCERLIEFGRAA